MRTEVATLRILVVSHAAVVETNQEPFAALAAAGHEVRVIAPRALETDIRGRVRLRALDGLGSSLLPLPVVLGGHRRWLGGQRGIHLILYRGLARVIREQRPDLIFVEEEPFSLAAWQVERTGARFVVHENQNIARRLPPPFAQIRRRVLARAAGVTVRNQAAADLVRAEGFGGPIGSFPHAIDPSRYDVSAADAGLARPVVGFFGRLVPEKGILDLIATLEGSKTSLLVVGDGPSMAEARALVERFHIPARFTGALPHDQVPAWYGACDVVVIPSRTMPTWMEQFGRIVIEANAAGVPVVVSDSGELPHTVGETGGGVVFPEGDRTAMREAVGALLGDEQRRRALGERGKAVVRERYTARAIGAELGRFLAEVGA